MINVCDAIMGSGKTSAAINYINEHPDEKFIFITPYLSEAARIKHRCPDANFVEPSDKLSQYGFRKSTHTEALIAAGENIATTHQAFIGYTRDMLKVIEQQGYTLIIDENVDVLESFSFSSEDLDMLVMSGYLSEEDGVYSMSDKEYHGTSFADFFRLIKSRSVVKVEDPKKNATLFFWALPPDLITSFKSVYVLTYLFEGQSLHHMFQMYGLAYRYIGINVDGGMFRFGDLPGYRPKYLNRIRKKIHIVNKSLNDVGKERFALSMNWFKKNKVHTDIARKSLNNCVRNVWSDIPADEKLWGSYNMNKVALRGKGYSKSFLPFNARAMNAYRNRTHLAYFANVFMNAGEKLFYTKHGVDVNEDLYALSTMVQWIWRSAIRDGKDIYIFIPSSRMRGLLFEWLDKI